MSDKYWLDDKGMPHKIGAEISLRDWFAGQALLMPDLYQFSEESTPEGRAKAAYEIADAMLAARPTTPPEEGEK